MIFVETIVSIHQASTFVFGRCTRKYNLGKAWGMLGECFGEAWRLHDEKHCKLRAKLPLPQFCSPVKLLSETIYLYVCVYVCMYERMYVEALLGTERPREAQ